MLLRTFPSALASVPHLLPTFNCAKKEDAKSQRSTPCALPRKRSKFWSSIAEWVPSQVRLPCGLPSASGCAPTDRRGESRQWAVTGPPDLTQDWARGSACGPIHACERRRKEEMQRGFSNPGCLNTPHAMYPPPSTTDCILCANENVRPQKVTFQIDNPHPHKENKFLFI